MKNNFDIGITTFSLRYDFVERVITKIRQLGVENNIFLCINGEKDSAFDETYRKKILTLCLNNPNVYPIFFVEVRGLSKMWNTLLIHSTKENVLIMNDDVMINNQNIFDVVSSHIESPEYFGLTKINNTFSYFVANKKVIDELGYFDERLLGFGEEDGDITYRCISKFKKYVHNIHVDGVHNIVSDIRHTHVKSGIGKYSWFNRNFVYTRKYSFNNPTSGIRGMFDGECDVALPDVNLYPYEKFFQENKHNL